MSGNNRKVAAIIPAAGTGQRALAGSSSGGLPPKQFCTIMGIPLIQHTLTAILSAGLGQISRIVLVVSKGHMARATKMLSTLDTGGCVSIDLVVGGSSRHRSILEALRYLEGTNRKLLTTLHF